MAARIPTDRARQTHQVATVRAKCQVLAVCNLGNACAAVEPVKTTRPVTRYVHRGKAHRIDAVNKLELVNAAKEIAEVEKRQLSRKTSPQCENPANLLREENEVSVNDSTKRRRSDSNRCIKVLQTIQGTPSGVLTGLNRL
jgi:hypothetical protein